MAEFYLVIVGLMLGIALVYLCRLRHIKGDIKDE